MQTHWKPVQVIVPVSLSPREVLNHIHAQIRIIASEAGDFVNQIHIGVGEPYSNDWTRWNASYLPGPPATFPTVQQEPALPVSAADRAEPPNGPAQPTSATRNSSQLAE